MSQVRKKPLCLVKIDDKKTERRKRNFELDLCSKGTKECRHSNSRLASQINRLNALSPRVDDAFVAARMMSLRTPSNMDMQSAKPASSVTFQRTPSMRPNQEMYSALKNTNAKKKSIFSTSKKQSIGNRRQTMAATLEANRSNSQLL